MFFCYRSDSMIIARPKSERDSCQEFSLRNFFFALSQCARVTRVIHVLSSAVNAGEQMRSEECRILAVRAKTSSAQHRRVPLSCFRSDPQEIPRDRITKLLRIFTPMVVALQLTSGFLCAYSADCRTTLELHRFQLRWQ